MTMMDAALATPVLYLPDPQKPFFVPEKMKVSVNERSCTGRNIDC